MQTVVNGVATTQMSLTGNIDFVYWTGTRTKWSALQPLGRVPIVLANPVLACSPLTGDYTGKVVLMMRGTCTADVKGANTVAANAAGGECDTS